MENDFAEHCETRIEIQDPEPEKKLQNSLNYFQLSEKEEKIEKKEEKNEKEKIEKKEEKKEEKIEKEVATCRYCLEPETVNSPLISPCACDGSAQFIHEACIKKKKTRLTDCELCNQKYATNESSFFFFVMQIVVRSLLVLLFGTLAGYILFSNFWFYRNLFFRASRDHAIWFGFVESLCVYFLGYSIQGYYEYEVIRTDMLVTPIPLKTKRNFVLHQLLGFFNLVMFLGFPKNWLMAYPFILFNVTKTLWMWITIFIVVRLKCLCYVSRPPNSSALLSNSLRNV